jgi:glyoxylase-like metal-dependent hydrolase (beta-lactamase superfamily II)
MQQVAVGNIEVTALVDGTRAYDASKVYADTADRLGEHAEHLDPEGRVTLIFGCFLLRDAGRTILVDTGNGPEAEGQLLSELQTAGVSPAEVDLVLFTHLHGDHTGWNIDRATGKPLFTRARYLVPRGDWDHYSQQDPPPRSFGRDIEPLQGLGALELIDDDHVLTPSITTVHTPGHTPGHMALALSSEGHLAYVIGDAFITPIDVAEPDWVTTWDSEAAPVRETRRMLISRIEGANALVAASHLPGAGLGHFVHSEGIRKWRPIG